MEYLSSIYSLENNGKSQLRRTFVRICMNSFALRACVDLITMAVVVYRGDQFAGGEPQTHS